MSRLLEALSDGEQVGYSIPGADTSVFLTCEHAGNALPKWIGSLSDDENRVLGEHWGWDIGALGLSRVIAETRGFPLVASTLSRLVCDLNRPTDAGDLYREECDGVALRFNMGLDETAHSRRCKIHEAFHGFTTETMKRQQPDYLVSIHSFTPEWRGVKREVEVGILFNAYEQSAERIARRLRREGVLARLNEPYSGFADGVYSIERHGKALNRPYVELEVRQDLIGTEEGQRRWGALLSQILSPDLFS